MRKITNSILFLLLAAVVAGEVEAQRQTRGENTPPGAAATPMWKAKIAGEDAQEILHSVVAADGTTWLLASTRPVGAEPAQLSAVRLIAIDTNGRETASYDVAGSIAAKNVIRFDGIALMKDGSVAVVVTTALGELVGVTLNAKTGAPIVQMRIGSMRRDHFVSQILPAEDGRLLLVGRLDGRGWLMKLDATLGIRWEKTLEDEPLTVIFDAVVNPDGSIAAVGGQLLESGVTNVWVGVLSVEAQVIARRSFPGRDARIARNDRGYAIVHDVRGDTAGWDVRARGFSAGLDEEWSATIAEGLDIPSRFEIASRPRGGWLVTGPKARQLWVAELRDGGETAWSYTLPRESAVWERLWNVGSPALADGSLIVPFTLFTVDERERQRLVIRVVKLPFRA